MVIEAEKSSPVLFEVKSDVTIGGDFTDPAYHHLGHEGYPVVFSRERQRILEGCGLTLQSLETDFGIRAFVRKLEVDYQVPVKEGDDVTLVTTATLPRPFELVFHHVMSTGAVVDARSDCSYMVLNLQNRPVRVPPALLDRLNQIGKTEMEDI